ncbi:MAG: VCBS repeat-containing protein, partial [Planctomycetota bacterium]
RFEMPPLIKVEPVRFEERAGASIGVIESRSRRVVFYDVVMEQIETVDNAGFAPERDTPFEVYAFPGATSGTRAVTVADIDQDGLDDVLVADPDGNALSLHLQQQDTGIREGTTFSTFKKSNVLAAGEWVEGGPLEVFVMSEDENVVGVSTFDPQTGRLRFPRPLRLANPGATPVAMAVLGRGSDSLGLAVVVRERRDHWLEVLTPDAEPRAIELDPIDRPPTAILSGDFDGDGTTDVLLTSDDQPPVMVLSVEDPEPASVANGRVLDDTLMPQVGLLQAAGPTNTAAIDIDNDGSDEVLISAENFVRACTYDADSGWRVIEQMAVTDARASFSGLTVTTANGAPGITVADTGNERLVVFAQDESGAWTVADRLRVPAFDLGALTGGAFSGDGEPNILCHSADGIAIARLRGERVALSPFATYRSDEEDQYEYQMASGDINADGYTDVVILDAGDQRCKVFTFSSSRRLLEAFEFETFQRRLFDGSEGRTFEPRDVILKDATGDGVADMVFEVHDRYVIHPSQSR